MDNPLDLAAGGDEAVKLQSVTQFIAGAEPLAQQAREFAVRAAAYRRNQWLLEIEESGNVKLLQEEETAAGREYWSIPWSLYLALVRVARYSSAQFSWQLRYGADREQERYIDEQAFALITRYLDPERERVQPLMGDSMGMAGHSVYKVTWDKNSGPVERVAVETEEPTNTQLRVEKVDAEVGVVRKRKVEQSRIVYHAVDEFGRLKYVERHLGAPKFEVLGPTNYNIDPVAGAEGMAKARYAYDVRRISAGEVYERFPGKRAALDGFDWSHNIVASSTEQSIRNARGQSNSSESVKSGVLVDFYLKPSPEYNLPNGLHCVLLAPEFSSNADLPGAVILAWEDWPWVTLPYFDGACEILDSNDYWGSLLFLVTAPAQREFNELMTIAIDNVKRGASIVLGGSQAEGIAGGAQATPISGLPNGFFVAWSRQTQDVKLLANVGATNQQVELATMIKNIGEGTSAARNPEGKLATEMVMNAGQDKAVLDNAVAGLTRCTTNATLYGVELFRRHWGMAEFQRAMPDFSEGDIKEFLNSQPMTTLRLTTKQVTLMSDPEAAVTILKILPQFGPDALKIFPADYLADMLQTQRQFGQSIRDLQQFKARRENTMLRYGKKVLVDPSDEDSAHLEEMGYYDSDHSLRMSHAEGVLRFAHRTAHEKAMDEKLVKNAVRQARAQMAVAMEIQNLKAQVNQAMQPEQPAAGQVPGGAPTARG